MVILLKACYCDGGKEEKSDEKKRVQVGQEVVVDGIEYYFGSSGTLDFNQLAREPKKSTGIKVTVRCMRGYYLEPVQVPFEKLWKAVPDA